MKKFLIHLEIILAKNGQKCSLNLFTLFINNVNNSLFIPEKGFLSQNNANFSFTC